MSLPLSLKQLTLNHNNEIAANSTSVLRHTLTVSLHSRVMNHSTPLATLLSSVLILLGTGCKHTEPYDAAVYTIFGPVAVAAMPGYAFAEGTRILSESGKKRVYLPAGLTEAQVEEQIAQLPGQSRRRIHWKKDGTQLWRVTR